MSIDHTRSGTPLMPVAVLLTSVIATSVALTWAYLGMRAVMDVGGACADGGPFVSAQPCPNGATLLSLAIPLLLAAAFVGSAVALSLKAPALLIPVWGFLFCSLGWNFLDYGFQTEGGLVIGWIICGVMFMIMGLPALALMLRLDFGKKSSEGQEHGSKRISWWAIYIALGITGVAVGVWSFNSWS